MKIYNTLTGKFDELDISKKIRIYLCGVTVYDEAHIGHARTIIIFDVLRRYLEAKGCKVEFIQNFTDVDDKIINRAKKENVSPSEISKKFIENYFRDFDSLNIKRATIYPKATDHIEDIIKLIEKLINKGFAYVSKNGVYFSVSKFPDYGKLSKKKIDELKSGARIEIDEQKKDPLDFALWKFSNEEPSWDSPWGRGRPGWHIECSAMSLKYLGENFEIHGGGRDLIFPHHENEIAQSEASTCKPFAKIWMHVGMVTIKGEKMSKSLGNVKTVRYVVEKWGPNVIRLFCISGHYSKPIDYSEELLKENLIKWRQIEIAYHELIQAPDISLRNSISSQLSEVITNFNNALENDFNTHEALVAFFNLIKEVNQLAAKEMITKNEAKKILIEFDKMMNVLGLVLPDLNEQEKNEINFLILKRQKLRADKKFEDADKIRSLLIQKNIELIDHKNRTVWVKKEKIPADETI